jgi:hypothetical protein
VEIRGLELNRKWCDVIQRIRAARPKSRHPWSGIWYYCTLESDKRVTHYKRK